jgi:copper chaperone CopZ
MVFKTTINCSSCIRSISPSLNSSVGEGNWSVDIENPDKLLTVSNAGFTPDMVKHIVEEAGFEAALISARNLPNEISRN